MNKRYEAMRYDCMKTLLSDLQPIFDCVSILLLLNYETFIYFFSNINDNVYLLNGYY